MAGPDSLSEVTPLFIKNSDLGNRMSEFGMCSLIAENIDDSGELIGCQRIGGLWRIYFKSDNTSLLSRELKFNDRVIPVYKQNPFRTGAESPNDTFIRITVKDLPLSIHNRTLEEYLKKEGVTMARTIEYARARDPATHQLTNWFNGDRVIHARAIAHNFPRNIQIGNFACRIFHEGQETKPLLCTNCFKKDHTRSRCKLPAACKACRKTGHNPGDEACENYQAKNLKLTIIQENNEPLSNTYECELKVMGMTFNSAEQAYQYSKAIRRGQPDIANDILKSPSPKIAKSKAKFLKYDEKWTKDQKMELMQQILTAKAEQVPDFKSALVESGKQPIVYANKYEYEWASGMTAEETQRTKKCGWPGQNLLGTVLDKIRASFNVKKNTTK
jgi:hypothetical protein